MDRGHGELGDGSDISAAPLIKAAARMKGLSLLVNSTVRVQSGHWTRARHFRAKSSRNLLADATLPFSVFTRSQPISPARSALRSQSNVATLSSCATGEGAMD
jgi:hypothetical protein